MTSFDVITQLVELTSNATNAFTAALYSLDPNKKTMSVRAYMSLSTHFDAEACFSYGKGPIGLPLGLQVVGRLDDDARTLAWAHWIHQRIWT